MKYTKQNPLLMIPGPVESHQSVLDGLSKRTYAHTEMDFIESYQNSLNNLRAIFQVSSYYSPLIVAGSGTLAMEIAMTNLIDQDKTQKALICNTGYFGDRFEAIAKSYGLKFETIKSEIGFGIDEEILTSKLEKEDFDLAFIQHVDTSTGVANDVKTFGTLCQENEVISVVDGVCALGGEEFYQESWNIDICFTGAQKALAVPPGLAIMMYSPRAREISETKITKVASYYTDLNNWWPIMEAYQDGSAKYFSTPSTNLITALEIAIEQILDEGVVNVFSRHKRLSEKFRKELIKLDFEFLTNIGDRSVTLSTPLYKDIEKGNEFRKSMLENGVLIAGGIQSGVANRYFRVGHMGNVSEEQIDFTLNAIEKLN